MMIENVSSWNYAVACLKIGQNFVQKFWKHINNQEISEILEKGQKTLSYATLTFDPFSIILGSSYGKKSRTICHGVNDGLSLGPNINGIGNKMKKLKHYIIL